MWQAGEDGQHETIDNAPEQMSELRVFAPGVIM
jgi:hypothetical protein